MRLGVVVNIGILAVALQPIRAQSTAAELSQIDPGDAELSRWVADQARSGPGGWQVVWQRFLGMGGCAEEFVGSGLLSEKDRELRLVLTGAYLVTTRRHVRTLLHRKIAARQHPDRIMAMFVLALGPPQAGPDKLPADWLKRAKKPLEQVAACLALSRFKAVAELPDAVLGKTRDAGVLAAALYCRPGKSEAWVKSRLKQWSARGEEEHAHLVWRAYLLGGGAPKSDPDRRKLALRILQYPEHQALQESQRMALPEAAHFLARDGRVAVSEEVLLKQEVDIKLHLAASPDLRRQLLRNVDIRLRGTTSDILLRRWWALFTRFAPMDAVLKALSEWGAVDRFKRDESLRTSIGLALAWRLFRLPEAEAAALSPDISQMIDTPAGAWLQLALGKARTAATSHTAYVDLARAYPLANQGRLPRPRVADLLEAALWREGGHPARATVGLHRQLQAELMIDGSAGDREGYAQIRGAEIYAAKGVSRDDSPLFPVANEFYRFVKWAEPWSMPEYRFAN